MISKSVKPSMAFYSLMTLTELALCLPFLIFGRWDPFAMPGRFWLLLSGSMVGEVAYMLGLARAYDRSDISLVYPVVRALPVLMVPAVTLIFGIGSRELGAVALFGMAVITAGCLIMPQKRFSDFSLKSYCSSAIGFILLAAAGTTTYTVMDSLLVRMVQQQMGRKCVWDTLSLLFWIELGLFIGEFLLAVSNRNERRLLKTLAFRSIYPLLAGCCSGGAYALVLLAMGQVTNVSYLQAFRQMSLPVGFLAGLLILKEKGAWPKYVGIVLIVGGLLCVALG